MPEKNINKKQPNLDYLLKLSDRDVIKKIKNVRVVYSDRKHKDFDAYNWNVFKSGIIKNLYNKNLCNIHFQKKLKHCV